MKTTESQGLATPQIDEPRKASSRCVLVLASTPAVSVVVEVRPDDVVPSTPVVVDVSVSLLVEVRVVSDVVEVPPTAHARAPIHCSYTPDGAKSAAPPNEQ